MSGKEDARPGTGAGRILAGGRDTPQSTRAAPEQPALDLDGEQLRDEGITLVDSAVSEAWRAHAAETMARCIARGLPFDAEDFRRELRGWEPTRPSAIGAVFRKASQRGDIRAIGWREAERATAHRRALRVWVRAA